MALDWMADVMPNMADGIATVVHNVLCEFVIFMSGRWKSHCGRF